MFDPFDCGYKERERVLEKDYEKPFGSRDQNVIVLRLCTVANSDTDPIPSKKRTWFCSISEHFTAAGKRTQSQHQSLPDHDKNKSTVYKLL